MATSPKTKHTAAAKPTGKYWEGVGRRKTSTARVRIYKGTRKLFLVNQREFKTYFPQAERREHITSPMVKTDNQQLDVTVVVKGGGVSSQADAVRHGLARAILLFDKEQRPLLRTLGYLTRDSRMRERKKPGLKRARRAPQWSKR